ncbi:hypothetical protein D9611_002541 [Ephemerocybe angulata]|uniref:Protein-tyrosine phosphatase-like protein n=2 Tax=Ephemerocybe angulata TaxID=980116 RepID=A0A8H6IB15_9AGAR|nr:hypothetical protein D9611_002541 [Tulosesus angulatus]KAF6762193.1 protein-tyrosine phosphatase-like protein [Tulosesus angulatus]
MGQWKNINPIIENRLFLGNILAARSTRSLTERRITHILSVCNDEIPAEVPESGLTHMRIPVEDVDYADLLIHLPGACRWIDQALRGGGVVLVHCYQGLSRSAAVIAAYVMWSRRVNATQALEFVRSARDQIWINPGFQEQLVLFELCNYQPSPANGIYVKWRHGLDHRLRAAGLLR